jgi:hypothetical protein
MITFLRLHDVTNIKFLDRQPYVAEMIRLSARPRDAFDLAHQHRQLARDDWFKVNIKMVSLTFVDGDCIQAHEYIIDG